MKANMPGFTLLEVLIAVLVLSIGMVGIAALNISALQNVHSAHYRSLAAAIALDFEERLWGMLPGTTEGACPDAGDLALEFNDPESVWKRPSPWLGLPGFSITLGALVTNGATLRVPLQIGWTEGRLLDVAGEETFEYEVRILCR